MTDQAGGAGLSRGPGAGRRTLDLLLGAALAGMTGIVAVNIVTRHVFFTVRPGRRNWRVTSFAYLIIFGARVGVREDRQIRVDVIDTAIKSPERRRVLAWIQLAVQLAAAPRGCFFTAPWPWSRSGSARSAPPWASSCVTSICVFPSASAWYFWNSWPKARP